MSPGQYCIVKHMSKLVAQPTHPLTHTMLSNFYGLPKKRDKTVRRKSSPGELLVGSTVEHLTTLPKLNRRNPLVYCNYDLIPQVNILFLQLTPPPISQTDAHKGLLSLIERGLIPVRAHKLEL